MDYSNIRVLIVDDYSTMINIVRNLCQQIGFTRIDSAPAAETAFALIKSAHNSNQPYGLVICDWTMIPLSGYDLLKNVRNTGAGTIGGGRDASRSSQRCAELAHQRHRLRPDVQRP